MIFIRKFNRSDFETISEFYRRSFNGDVNRKIEAFRWLQIHNPFINCENNYLLLFKDANLVGYWGLMPIRFYFWGRPFFTLFSQEALIDPAYRDQGLATKLLSEINKSNQFMVSLWHNERIMKILGDGGWSKIGNYRPLKKIYNIEKILNLKLRYPYLAKFIVPISKQYFKKRFPVDRDFNDYKVEFVQKCGSEYDDFFVNITSKFCILSDRTSKTLTWKYIDIPYRKYSFLEVRHNATLCGYMVLRIEKQRIDIKKGIIVDVLVDPGKLEALACLVRKSEDIFIENKVDFSVCVVQPKIFRSVFKESGYYEAKSKETDSLWIYNEDKIPDKEQIKDIGNWYITYGESDGDMW